MLVSQAGNVSARRCEVVEAFQRRGAAGVGAPDFLDRYLAVADGPVEGGGHGGGDLGDGQFVAGQFEAWPAYRPGLANAIAANAPMSRTAMSCSTTCGGAGVRIVPPG